MSFSRDLTLYAIAAVGIPAVVRAFARWFSRESLRPDFSRDWSERDFGDQPHIGCLSHFGTHSTEA